MPIFIPDIIARVDKCASITDAWPYQPIVRNEHDQIIWSGPTLTYSAERALEMAERAVEALCYTTRHQLQLFPEYRVDTEVQS